MAARAKKTNRSKRVDSVRASRDGHQFHEASVATSSELQAWTGTQSMISRSDSRRFQSHAASGVLVVEWVRAPTYVPPLHDIRGLKPRLRQR